MTFTVTNDSKREMPFPFERYDAIQRRGWSGNELSNPEIYDQIKKSLDPKFEKGTSEFGHRIEVIKPGQTAELIIDFGIPATPTPTEWYTVLTFRKELVSDCEILIFAVNSGNFYRYVPVR